MALLDVIDFEPVDRGIEVELLVRYALEDRQSVNKKSSVLFTSQLFGSGKTFFGQHAIGILKNDLDHNGPITRSLLGTEYIQGPDRCSLHDLRAAQQGIVTLEDVARIANARTICVPLNKFEAMQVPDRAAGGKPRLATFYETFNAWVWARALSPAASAAEAAAAAREIDRRIPELLSLPLSSLLLQYVGEEAGHTGLWFLFVDEAGAVEQQLGSMFPGEFAVNGTEKLGNYRTLLAAFCQAIGHGAPAFAFLAGKSRTLVAHALQEAVTSPVRLRYLALGALHPPDIETILRNTKYNGRLLVDILGAQAWLEGLARVLYLLSGGIPRLVEALVTLLVLREARRVPLPSTPEQVEALLGPKGEEGAKLAREMTTVLTTPTLEGESAPEIYATLLLTRILGIPLRLESLGMTLDEMSVFALYVEPSEAADMYSIVTSSYLIDWLRHSGAPPVMALSNILEACRGMPSALDAGRVLELITVQAIAARLLAVDPRVTLGKAVEPLFQGTQLEGLPVGSIASHMREAGEYILPCPAFRDGGEDNPARTTYNTDNQLGWLEAVQAHYDVLLLPEIKTSASADAFLLVSTAAIGAPPAPDSTAPATALDRLASAVHISCKNLWSSSSPLQWKDVAEEINKCLDNPRRHGLERPIVLAIVATTMGPELYGQLANGRRVFHEGNYYYSRSSKAITHRGLGAPAPHNIGDTTLELKFTVPAQCELVIVSPPALGGLLLQNAVEDLRKHFGSGEQDPVAMTNALLSAHGLAVSNVPKFLKRMREEQGGTERAPASKQRRVAAQPHELFADPKKKIDLAWLQAVFPEKDPKKLELWTQKLLDNEVDDVGTLAEQNREALERWGLPGAIAGALAKQAALCPK